MVDVSKIEAGDRITLADVGVVQVVRLPAPACVKVSINGLTVWVEGSQITAHRPKPKPPLAVGDKVSDGYGCVWEIAGAKRSNECVGEFRQDEYPLWRGGWGFATRAAEDVESWERVS